MKLQLDDAKAVLAIENTDVGLPTRGVHIRRDGTPGTEPGARYVDLDAPDRPGWTVRVREETDDPPLDVCEACAPKIKDSACKKRVEDEIKKAQPAKAEKV